MHACMHMHMHMHMYDCTCMHAMHAMKFHPRLLHMHPLACICMCMNAYACMPCIFHPRLRFSLILIDFHRFSLFLQLVGPPSWGTIPCGGGGYPRWGAAYVHVYVYVYVSEVWGSSSGLSDPP